MFRNQEIFMGSGRKYLGIKNAFTVKRCLFIFVYVLMYSMLFYLSSPRIKISIKLPHVSVSLNKLTNKNVHTCK